MNRLIVTMGLPGSGDIVEYLHEDLPEGNYTMLDLTTYTDYSSLIDSINTLFSNGISVICKGYNLKLETRIKLLELFKDIKGKKICYFVIRPFEQCLKNNTEVDEETLYNMYYNIQTPWYYEGWDEIILKRVSDYGISTRDLFLNDNYGLKNTTSYTKKGDVLPLSDKLYNTHKFAVSKRLPLCVQTASLFYNIGLPFAKAHMNPIIPRVVYNVSSYMSLFFSHMKYENGYRIIDNNNHDKKCLEIAAVIQWLSFFGGAQTSTTKRLFNTYVDSTKNPHLYKNIKSLADLIDKY
jgi:hypothetical protein